MMNRNGSTLRFQSTMDMERSVGSSQTNSTNTALSINPFDSMSCNEVPSLIRTDESLFLSPENNMSSESSFKWTIDEVSACKPAEIEVNVNQFDPVEKHDDSFHIQTHIHNNNVIVPSPVKFVAKDKLKDLSNSNNVAVQTSLTLPYQLPEEVLKVLEPYFTKPESSPLNELSLSALNFASPIWKKNIINTVRRAETPHSNRNRFSDCSISPIENRQSLDKENLSALTMMDVSYVTTPKSKFRKRVPKNLTVSFMDSSTL